MCRHLCICVSCHRRLLLKLDKQIGGTIYRFFLAGLEGVSEVGT